MAFKIEGKTVFLCDCSGTMRLDKRQLASALNVQDDFSVYTQLCSRELHALEAELTDSDAIVACTQEVAVFNSIAEKHNGDVKFIHPNIREYATWGEEASGSGPKVSALLSAAAIETTPPDAVTMVSTGRVLVRGTNEEALQAASQLSGRLDVTLMLNDPCDLIPPSTSTFKIVSGRIELAKGHFGNFRVFVEDFKEKDPSARTVISFASDARSVDLEFDLLLDLCEDPPLFRDSVKRDGYFRADPGALVKIQKLLFEIVDLVGTFDKPRYAIQQLDLCVHSRNKKIGCSRCLDNCPTSSITHSDDTVLVDEFVCAGCGQCASVCPTGAISYAVPSPEHQCEVFRLLLGKYLSSGGKSPVLLLHDHSTTEALLAIGRLGRGFPSNVIPWHVGRVTALGMDSLLAAIAFGSSHVLIVVGEKQFDELHALRGQLEVVDAILEGLSLGTGMTSLVDERDPSQLEEAIYQVGASVRSSGNSLSHKALRIGGKRDRIWLSLDYLKQVGEVPTEPISLPSGAAFGNVQVDQSACTLCLACVSVCPEGALLDNQERPQVSFVERSCIQCGLCRVTCPESAITLESRLNLADSSSIPRVLMEEEPFNCVRCDKPFGVRSTIDKMLVDLAEHPMFKNNESAINRIKMCEDCRVIDQFTDKQPLELGTRPLTRTSDDYSGDP